MITLILTTHSFNGTVTTFTDVHDELRARGYIVKLIIMYAVPPHARATQPLTMREFTDALQTFTQVDDVQLVQFTPRLARMLVHTAAKQGPVLLCRDTLLAAASVDEPPVQGLVLVYPLLVRAVWNMERWTLEHFNDLLAHHHVVVVGNRVNRQWITGGQYVHWPVGLARRRIAKLRAMTVAEPAEPLTMAQYNHARNQGVLTAFDHPRYLYRRREVGPGLTYENIGKLVFEFLLCGRTVHYSPAGKLMDDGLTEMLARFNVDDDVEQELIISVDVLEDELLDKPFDQLADIVDAYQHRRR